MGRADLGCHAALDGALLGLAHPERAGRQRHRSVSVWGGTRSSPQWARQMIRVVRRWLPHVAITVLGDQAYSVVELGHACRRCGVRLIAPLRLDAVFHEAPPPRQPSTRGRPRLKGRRLPTLAERLDDAATPWQPAGTLAGCGGYGSVAARPCGIAAASRAPATPVGILLDVSP